MLKKKSVSFLSKILVIAVILMSFGSVAFAAGEEGGTKDDGKPHITVPGATPLTDADVSGANEIVGKLLGIIQWGGVIAAVVIAMFVGVKYITASPDGKAEIKKTLGFYIGGMVLLAGASTIVGIIASTLGM